MEKKDVINSTLLYTANIPSAFTALLNNNNVVAK